MIKFIKYPFLFTFIIFIFYFYFFNLGYENINEDQYRWYDRTENFFSSLKKGDFAGTYQQYHPGIFFIYLIKPGIEIFKLISGINFNDFRTIPPEFFPLFNFYTKFFVTTFTLLSIFLLTYLIKERYGKFIALSFIVFLTFDTYFIGLTRNLHMDSLLSVLILVSLFSFYRYLESNQKVFLYLTIFYTGLGLLTKSVFLLAILFQFLIALYFFISNKFKFNALKKFGLILLSSFAIFIFFFPSMWAAPIQTLQKIYVDGALNTGLGGDDNFMHYVNGYEIPNPGFKFYLHVLNYRLSPMLFFSGILILIYVIVLKFKSPNFKLFDNPFILFIILFIITYLAIIFYSSKKTDRYLSIILPPIALTLAYYLKIVWQKAIKIYSKFLFLIFTLATIGINLVIHPFYFAYYNPIFGGVSQAQKRFYINQGGIGYLEVIKELQNFPNLKYSAVNYEELKYSTNLRIQPLNYYNFNEPRFVRVLPLQRGDNLIKTSDFVKNINILGQPFWRIYIQEK